MAGFDRQKYIELLHSQGLATALSELHHDKEKLEIETFEGREGYQRKLWNDLEEVRNFSLELWDMGLKLKSEPST